MHPWVVSDGIKLGVGVLFIIYIVRKYVAWKLDKVQSNIIRVSAFLITLWTFINVSSHKCFLISLGWQVDLWSQAIFAATLHNLIIYVTCLLASTTDDLTNKALLRISFAAALIQTCAILGLTLTSSIKDELLWVEIRLCIDLVIDLMMTVTCPYFLIKLYRKLKAHLKKKLQILAYMAKVPRNSRAMSKAMSHDQTLSIKSASVTPRKLKTKNMPPIFPSVSEMKSPVENGLRTPRESSPRSPKRIVLDKENLKADSNLSPDSPTARNLDSPTGRMISVKLQGRFNQLHSGIHSMKSPRVLVSRRHSVTQQRNIHKMKQVMKKLLYISIFCIVIGAIHATLLVVVLKGASFEGSYSSYFSSQSEYHISDDIIAIGHLFIIICFVAYARPVSTPEGPKVPTRK